MDDKSLMIGDWVKVISTSELIKITEIIECLDDLYDVGCEEFRTTISNITPIPLTEDILKANGFYQSSIYWKIDYPFFYIADYGKDGEWSLYSYNKHDRIHNIKYVHELQHALRLCGLKELANNFKIE